MLGNEYNHPIVMENYWIIHSGILNFLLQIGSLGDDLAALPKAVSGYGEQKDLDIRRRWLQHQIGDLKVRIRLIREASVEFN